MQFFRLRPPSTGAADVPAGDGALISEPEVSMTEATDLGIENINLSDAADAEYSGGDTGGGSAGGGALIGDVVAPDVAAAAAVAAAEAVAEAHTTTATATYPEPKPVDPPHGAAPETTKDMEIDPPHGAAPKTTKDMEIDPRYARACESIGRRAAVCASG